MNIANFNYAEATLWFLIAAIFFVFTLKLHRSLKADSTENIYPVLEYRKLCVYTAIAFVAFGITDLIEAQTGAWWRPWPLLVFKALCLIMLAVNYRKYRLITIKFR